MEGIYYSHVIPRDSAILTLMGLVFDKVRFPGAHLPTSGFDMKELEKENGQLKRIVANQALDIDMLKHIAEGKF